MRILAVILALVLAPAAQAASLTPEQKEEVRALVRAYLLENPEILYEMSETLERRAAEAESKAVRDAVKEHAKEVFDSPHDFAIGPKDAKVTIVEFFDYNCGYCKTAAPWIKDVIERHKGKVRVIFKETPIFADRQESSGLGARFALAAKQQGKYLDLHFALMAARGVLTVEQVRAAAKAQGLDMRWLDNAAKAPEIAAHTEDTLALFSKLNFSGTPAFLVNGEPVAGADLARLEALLAAELAES